MSMVVVTGARVWTSSRAFEERSIWIRDGRILELTPASVPVGSADGLRVMSWPGRFIVPGFVDAHTHLMAVATKELRCDLAPARDADDAVARLASYAAARDGEAIVGVDFDESEWATPALPTRAMLNAISSTIPVYARRVCCHVGVANDALLARLTSAGGFVDRETGRIVEEAVFEANRITRPPEPDVIASVDTAIAILHALGITAIHDIVDPDSIPAYAAGLFASRRPLGIVAYLHLAAAEFAAARTRLDELSAGKARALGIKIFSDGSLGGRTAALHERYADADTTGDLLVTVERMQSELEACAREDIACAIHAIGDRALASVLDACERARVDPACVRIEHAEVIGDDELERCRRLRVPLVMQPNFVRNWGGEGGLYAARLGPARWRRQNPFATLVRANVPFVFSSDAMPSGPLYGMRGATLHAVESERIGPAEALYRYTGAASVLPGGNGGRLAPGAAADLVVLSGNPVLADLDRIRVEATIVGGLEVHRAPAVARPTSHSNRRR